jgi:hypothetical protein
MGMGMRMGMGMGMEMEMGPETVSGQPDDYENEREKVQSGKARAADQCR